MKGQSSEWFGTLKQNRSQCAKWHREGMRYQTFSTVRHRRIGHTNRRRDNTLQGEGVGGRRRGMPGAGCGRRQAVVAVAFGHGMARWHDGSNVRVEIASITWVKLKWSAAEYSNVWGLPTSVPRPPKVTTRTRWRLAQNSVVVENAQKPPKRLAQHTGKAGIS